MKNKHHTIKDYIELFVGVTRERLERVFEVIKNNAPMAEESISYGMPAFKLAGKPLVYFAGYDRHIGLYALPSGHQKFKKELSGFKQGKGSVQFPHDQPLPTDLIKKILKFRVQENLKNSKTKKITKTRLEEGSARKSKSINILKNK